MKITIEDDTIIISKGTESIILHLDHNRDSVWISATDQSGGYEVATLKIEDDRVIQVEQ